MVDVTAIAVASFQVSMCSTLAVAVLRYLILLSLPFGPDSTPFAEDGSVSLSHFVSLF